MTIPVRHSCEISLTGNPDEGDMMPLEVPYSSVDESCHRWYIDVRVDEAKAAVLADDVR